MSEYFVLCIITKFQSSFVSINSMWMNLFKISISEMNIYLVIGLRCTLRFIILYLTPNQAVFITIIFNDNMFCYLLGGS